MDIIQWLKDRGFTVKDSKTPGVVNVYKKRKKVATLTTSEMISNSHPKMMERMLKEKLSI